MPSRVMLSWLGAALMAAAILLTLSGPARALAPLARVVVVVVENRTGETMTLTSARLNQGVWEVLQSVREKNKVTPPGGTQRLWGAGAVNPRLTVGGELGFRLDRSGATLRVPFNMDTGNKVTYRIVVTGAVKAIAKVVPEGSVYRQRIVVTLTPRPAR